MNQYVVSGLVSIAMLLSCAFGVPINAAQNERIMMETWPEVVEVEEVTVIESELPCIEVEEEEPEEIVEEPVVHELCVEGSVTEAVDQNELELLACVIYQEAGAEYVCDECRRRVADVVLNRVNDERYPDTIYEVLTQKAQYGRYHWTDVVWPASAYEECNAGAVANAYRIAEEVLRGEHSDVYGGPYIGQAEFTLSDDYIYCCGIYFFVF